MESFFLLMVCVWGGSVLLKWTQVVTVPASEACCISYFRKLLSVHPHTNLGNRTEVSGRKPTALYLPREEDPDDRVKYVWVYIIWNTIKHELYQRQKKSNWPHVPEPHCFPGAPPPLSDLCRAQNGSSEHRWNAPLQRAWSLVGLLIHSVC